jgi:ankyrin repeat protein
LTPALWNGGLEFAEAALARGAAPDRAISEKRPLLNDLIRWGQLTQVFWLLEHGANPNLPDERGWTAVHQAASRGNERMWRAVLEAGGDLHRRDDTGDTPGDVAEMAGKTKLLKRRDA